MGSRKDIIKKSLGITEYPWSSDDELEESNTPTGPDAPLLRRQVSESRPAPEHRPSIVDMPGSSGLVPPQPSPAAQQAVAAARRNQAREDRDLFWSILNSSHKMTPASTSSSRSRTNEMPLTYVSRVTHTPAPELRERSERPNTSADIRRIMTFKRLSRSVNALRHGRSVSGALPLTSRANPGAIVPSEANSASRINRHPVRRYYQPSASSSRNAFWPGRHPSSGAAEPAGAPPRPGARAREPAAPPPPHAPVVVQSSEDEINAGPVPLTSHPTTSHENERSMEQRESPEIEARSHNNSEAGVSLEEEIVEIDLDNTGASAQDALPEVASNADDVPCTSGARFSTEYRRPGGDPNMASTSDKTDGGPKQQNNHGVKRKRRESDDANPEPYTVKEFNQNLLSLLECPVCLEWMEPPMSQCRRGHLVCGRCRARLACCPVCRTTFSSVRNRAMEGVAEMLRYPCRHGCGREVRLRRRAPHEASCAARKYLCPAPLCADAQPLPRAELAAHFQSKHLPMIKIGRRHKFSMKVNSEQHDNWLILAMEEYFHLRIDVDIRTWGVIVYVSYIGPKCDAKNYTYEVTVDGQHNSRKLTYTRSTHSDLESSSLNVSRQDCFHLTLDQALNFIRFKNRHCDAQKFLDFNVEIAKVEPAIPRDDSDS